MWLLIERWVSRTPRFGSQRISFHSLAYKKCLGETATFMTVYSDLFWNDIWSIGLGKRLLYNFDLLVYKLR